MAGAELAQNQVFMYGRAKGEGSSWINFSLLISGIDLTDRTLPTSVNCVSNSYETMSSLPNASLRFGHERIVEEFSKNMRTYIRHLLLRKRLHELSLFARHPAEKQSICDFRKRVDLLVPTVWEIICTNIAH